MITRRNLKPIDRDWPAWRFGPKGESAIFQCAADVPDDWKTAYDIEEDRDVPRHPCEEHDPDELRSKLLELGVEVNPIWGTAHLKKVLDDRSTAR